MNNHKIYNEVESGIDYKVLVYTNDDIKDQINIDKFIKENKNCKIIETNNRIDITDIKNYHPYYNPGKI